MCGVVGLVYEKNNGQLGREGAALLKKLEYRGYDSTGGAFFKKDGSLVLKKKVGAPTRVMQELEIEKLSGCKFIGQVRWATYGAVDDDQRPAPRSELPHAPAGRRPQRQHLQHRQPEGVPERKWPSTWSRTTTARCCTIGRAFLQRAAGPAQPSTGPERRQADDCGGQLRQANLKAQGAYAACVQPARHRGHIRRQGRLLALRRQGQGRGRRFHPRLLRPDFGSGQNPLPDPPGRGRGHLFQPATMFVFYLASGQAAAGPG